MVHVIFRVELTLNVTILTSLIVLENNLELTVRGLQKWNT